MLPHRRKSLLHNTILPPPPSPPWPRHCHPAVQTLPFAALIPHRQRFGKCIRATPADASLYWARSHAWEKAGKRRQAVIDAGVGVCLRPRVAAGFMRLSAAFEAQGRHADVVRACFLVRKRFFLFVGRICHSLSRR